MLTVWMMRTILVLMLFIPPPLPLSLRRRPHATTDVSRVAQQPPPRCARVLMMPRLLRVATRQPTLVQAVLHMSIRRYVAFNAMPAW